jgi:hypothetical protein
VAARDAGEGIARCPRNWKSCSRSRRAPADGVKEGRWEAIAAEGPHEFGIDPRIAFEPAGDIGPCRYLDFADEMPERRWPEAVQVLDEELAAQPSAKFILRRGFVRNICLVNAV